MDRRADGRLGDAAFAVPASPMAQPWPIVGGNTLSALVGFAVGQAFGHGALACGLGVGLAIGGSLVDSAGWWFPLAPVALDAVLGEIGETFDIEREDLRVLSEHLGRWVLARRPADLSFQKSGLPADQ